MATNPWGKTTSVVWRKGQAPLGRYACWLYVMFCEWRSRLKSLSPEDVKILVNGGMYATVLRDPDSGSIWPGISIVARADRLELALENARRALVTPASTYILCPARALMSTIFSMDELWPGWHDDPTRIPEKAWKFLWDNNRFSPSTDSFDPSEFTDDGDLPDPDVLFGPDV